MPASQSGPTPAHSDIWILTRIAEWVRGFVTVQTETTVVSVTPDGLLKYVACKWLAWTENSIWMHFFWTFGSWQVLSEASSLISGYSPLPVTLRPSYPHPVLRKDTTEEPSLLLFLTGWLPSLKYTGSVHPQNIARHSVSLLRNRFEGRTGGVGRGEHILFLSL